MFDPDRIVGFEWDAGNRGKNLKHDVSDGEAEQVFFSHPLLVLEDVQHSSRESRYHALGQTADGSTTARDLHVEGRPSSHPRDLSAGHASKGASNL